MNPRVYEFYQTITLKDGTVKRVKKTKTYYPKRDKGYTKTEIANEIQKIENKEILHKIKDYIDQLKEEYKNKENDAEPGPQMDNPDIQGQTDQEV